MEPWPVLVSEVMLAQTRTARVAVRYGPFLERYPAPAAMAAAPLGEVLRDWEGLGYPRRAAALHRAASVLVDEHGGRVPSDVGALSALPGVGPYTARAVAAFGFGQSVMPVDTNVGRVLARAAAGSRLTPRRAQTVGDDLAASSPVGGRATAQAFMDLGAALCRAAVPSCGDCPLSEPHGAPACAWLGQRRQSAARGGAGPADPATFSAGVSRPQPPYEGSFRQGRGRLLRAAGTGPVVAAALAEAAGWPNDAERAERAAASLVSDGLLVRSASGTYRLP